MSIRGPGRAVIAALSLPVALLVACVGSQAATTALPGPYLGRWYYEGSSGGFSGRGLGDAAEGFIVIREDGHIERHAEDGALVETTPFEAIRGTTIFSTEEQWILSSAGDMGRVIQLSDGGRRMTLSENVYDGFQYHYARER